MDRVLAEDVAAERDQPPFDRVTMDGIAMAFHEWQQGRRKFTVVGTQPAGAPPLAVAAPDQCVEVMTGTVLPTGTDTVIPVERIVRARDGGRRRRRRNRQEQPVRAPASQRSQRGQPGAACRDSARPSRDCGAGRRRARERPRRGAPAQSP